MAACVAALSLTALEVVVLNAWRLWHCRRRHLRVVLNHSVPNGRAQTAGAVVLSSEPSARWGRRA